MCLTFCLKNVQKIRQWILRVGSIEIFKYRCPLQFPPALPDKLIGNDEQLFNLYYTSVRLSYVSDSHAWEHRVARTEIV